MVASDKLTLKAVPESVKKDGTSTLTATLTAGDDKPIPNMEVKFHRMKDDGSKFEIGTDTTNPNGTATTPHNKIKEASSKNGNRVTVWAVASVVSAGVGAGVGHAVEVNSEVVEIGFFDTQGEAELDIQLKLLAREMREQETQAQAAARQAQKVKDLQQKIESQIKTPAPPTEIGQTKASYTTAKKNIDQNVADADSKLTEIEGLISAQISKAKLDGLVAERAKVDKEINEFETQLSKLDQGIVDLKAKVEEAQKIRDDKKKSWEDAKDYQKVIVTPAKTLSDAAKGMVNNVKGAVSKPDLAREYLKLLDHKKELAEVKRKVIEVDALEKNLGIAWQQIVAQSQQVAALEYQLQQKTAERSQVKAELDEKNTNRPSKINGIIDGILK